MIATMALNYGRFAFLARIQAKLAYLEHEHGTKLKTATSMLELALCKDKVNKDGQETSLAFKENTVSDVDDATLLSNMCFHF
jgi:hypothetical protein